MLASALHKRSGADGTGALLFHRGEHVSSPAHVAYISSLGFSDVLLVTFRPALGGLSYDRPAQSRPRSLRA